MRSWIFSTQSNIIVVGVAYACSLFFVGNNAFAEEAPVRPKPEYVKVASQPLVVGKELERSVRFQALIARWHTERGATSSIEEMCTRPAYVCIMAMGPPAIPLIIGQLRSEGDNPDHWFVALNYLTEGVDPVPEEDKGDVVRMAAAWIEWADLERDAW